MHHPFLKGQKVYLRALERSDLAGKMFEWANDPDVTHFMYMGTFPNTIEALEREYDALIGGVPGNLTQGAAYPTQLVFAVIDAHDDVHIGNVGLYGISWINGVAEIRIVLGEKAYWGGGRATEAYTLAIRYAFDRLNLRRLYAGTRADHIASARVLEKLGFVQEGRQRQHFLRNNRPYDTVLFGLLRDEFPAVLS